MPAVNKCFENSDQLKNKYKTILQQQALINSFKKWCVNNQDIKMQQELILQSQKEDLMKIVPGCSIFCMKLYYISKAIVDKLEHLGQNIRKISLLPRGNVNKVVL